MLLFCLEYIYIIPQLQEVFNSVFVMYKEIDFRKKVLSAVILSAAKNLAAIKVRISGASRRRPLRLDRFLLDNFVHNSFDSRNPTSAWRSGSYFYQYLRFDMRISFLYA